MQKKLVAILLPLIVVAVLVALKRRSAPKPTKPTLPTKPTVPTKPTLPDLSGPDDAS